MNIKRSKKRYNQLCTSMEAQFKQFPFVGFENHLYIWNSKILKFYRWFAFSSLSSAEEREKRNKEQKLLDLYAPALESSLVGLNEDGSLSLEIVDQDFFCYGLLMNQGIPFLQKFWQQSSKHQRIEWARQIGKNLAKYHRNAPLLSPPFQDNSTIKINWLAEICQIIDKHCHNKTSLPSIKENILENSNKITNLIQQDQINESPIIHGDLNLSNIVLFDGEFQFVDPGYALPWGIGMKNADQLTFEVGWDLAAMANSFKWYGHSDYSDAFLTTYAIDKNWTNQQLKTFTIYWSALFSLMLVTVCLKFWDQLQTLEYPFSRELKNHNMDLVEYIRYHCLYALDLLDNML